MIDRAALFTWARIVALLILAFGLLGVSHKATAQTIQSAWTECQAHAVWRNANQSYGGVHQRRCEELTPYGQPNYVAPVDYVYGTFYQVEGPQFYYSVGCPSGSTLQWQDGTCYNPNEACETLQARTQDPNDGLYIAPGDSRTVSGTGAAECRGGCAFKANANDSNTVGIVTTGSGADAITTSQYGYTGEACPVVPASPAPAESQYPVKPTEQLCKTAPGSQLTLCVRQDGQHCYTATTGKQICWRPGETGTKTTGNLLQKREPGTVVSPVAPTPPAGETLAQSGTPTPTTTTTTVNNVTTTTNTTTTNYTTTGGTDAGSTDSGVPASGTGGTAPAGDGEGSGSVSAGTCEANYTCSGVSAVDCAILQETTKNRCATEANNPGKVMSAGEEAAATADGAGFTGTADSTGVTSETEYGADGLDDSGFLPGGRSCPTIPPMDILGQQFVMDTSAVCDWMTVGGYLVLLFGSIASLMILKGS